jgi:lipopolysaccharide/colanic/teichoic acid biosynthesis glycosyltransferase
MTTTPTAELLPGDDAASAGALEAIPESGRAYAQVVAPPVRRGFYDRFGKRCLDLALGVPLLLVAAPVVALLCLLVALGSRGPALYVAKRAGKGGREINVLKLRTMVHDADLLPARWRRESPLLAQEYAENFKLRDDPRVTAIGRILRRTSLDELPQLWNVVKGEMSLVGPRPYIQRELGLVPEAAAIITRVKPGLTGLWQVQGRNAIRPLERMRLDAAYAVEHSFIEDVSILARTIRPLLQRNGY